LRGLTSQKYQTFVQSCQSHLGWQSTLAAGRFVLCGKMLAAKVRHNRCVIRVASGRGKLSKNAIMFANPTVKVYNIFQSVICIPGELKKLN
jgi:hypothetical protein